MISQNNNFIYLIKEREFIRLNENIYKLGRTKQEPNRRLTGYPKNSEVLLFVQVRNCESMENRLIKSFKKKFIHKREYGREYFEGDKEKMMIEIYAKCQEELLDAQIDTKFQKLLDILDIGSKNITQGTDYPVNVSS